MNNYIKISLKGIPGYHPSYSYQDTFNVSGNEFYRTGNNVITIETTGLVSTRDSDVYRKRAIQDILTDKYTLVVYSHETANIQLLDIAEDIYIEDEFGTIHKANMLAPVSSVLVDLSTRKFKHTISYSDINTENYGSGNQMIINHLVNLPLLTNDKYPNLNEFYFLSKKEIDAEFTNAHEVYTSDPFQAGSYVIRSVIDIDEVTEKVLEAGGKNGEALTRLNRVVTLKQKRFTAYINEFDKQIVERYASMCYDNLGESGIIDRKNGTTTKAIQPISYEISEFVDGADLFQLNILLTYESVDFLPYLT